MRVRHGVGTALLALLAFAAVEPKSRTAQTAWQPLPGHRQLPIWPGCEVWTVSGLCDGVGSFALNPDIQVTNQTPPTFLLQAEDDPVDPVENSLVYYAALRKAGVATEIHVYAKGGHGFSLRPTESPIARWPQLAETWLRTIGIVTR